MTYEPGADGKPQLVLDGVAPVSQSERERHLIEQRKNAPMRGGSRPADFGLFSDEKDQVDLIDLLRKP